VGRGAAATENGQKVKSQGLTRILLSKIIILSLLLGSLFGVVQVILDFYDQYKIQSNAVDRIISVTSSSAARLALEMDMKGAKYLVNGLLETPYVVKVSLLNEFGEVLASQEKQLEFNPLTSRLTSLLSKKKDEYRIELHYPKDPSILIGQLALSVSWDHAMQPFYRRAVVVFLAGIVRALILACLLFFIIRIILARPMLRIINEISNTQSPQDVGKFRVQVPDASKGKELNELAVSVNSHLELISSYLDDIEEARNTFEERVEERTRELKGARLKAEAANLAKSVFLANMSHELRTPLNAILGTGQIMSRDTDFPEKYKENLGILAHSGEYLLSLVNDVLEISRIEAGRATLTKSVFSLKNALITIEEMTQLRTKKKGLELEVDYDPNIPENIRTDKAKLHQILNNLLDNAIKYTKKGGIIFRVHVVNSSGIRDNDHQPAGLAADKSSIINLRFIVEDTGIGISQEMQKNIFDHFVQALTTEESIKGVGLGLTICRQYASLMGGSISVKSQTGKASTFTVELPVESVDESLILPEAPKRRVVGLEPDQPMFNILIVEDDDYSRIVLRQLLEQVGFSVLEAKDGRQAVEMYKRMQPDLVWMDIRLSVMDGLDATKIIRNLESELQNEKEDKSKIHRLPIIALTASVFEEDKQKVLEAGCDDFVRKPFHENKIFDKMAQYLEVRYIYQDIQAPEEKPASPALTSDDLAGLPKDLVQRINAAARGAMSKQLLDLFEQIPPEFRHVADVMADLVSQYQFSKIIALTEKGKRDG